jgi:hypothetical protein
LFLHLWYICFGLTQLESELLSYLVMYIRFGQHSCLFSWHRMEISKKLNLGWVTATAEQRSNSMSIGLTIWSFKLLHCSTRLTKTLIRLEWGLGKRAHNFLYFMCSLKDKNKIKHVSAMTVMLRLFGCACLNKEVSFSVLSGYQGMVFLAFPRACKDC